VNAACEQDLETPAIVRARHALFERFHHLVPEHKARQWPYMAAAFPPLEDEALRTLVEEKRQEPRRRHVDVGRNAVCLKAVGLVGPSTCEKCKARTELPHGCELLGHQVGRREPEQSNAPGPALERGNDVRKQGLDVARLHESERQHG
jgi:hypothetical protein